MQSKRTLARAHVKRLGCLKPCSSNRPNKRLETPRQNVTDGVPHVRGEIPTVFQPSAGPKGLYHMMWGEPRADGSCALLQAQPPSGTVRLCFVPGCLALGFPRRMVTRSRSNRATTHSRTANEASSRAMCPSGRRTRLPPSGTSPSRDQVPQETAQRRLDLVLHRPQWREHVRVMQKALVLSPVAGSLPRNGQDHSTCR